MQDKQIIPADDAQQRIQLSALYQNTPHNLPPASSDIFHPNIEKLYLFRDEQEVTSFLEENPFLIPLLQEAYIHIKRHFSDSDIVLEVINASEAIGEEQLLAFIVVKQNAEEASQELDYLDEEWWLNNIKRAEDKLCIALEFR